MLLVGGKGGDIDIDIDIDIIIIRCRTTVHGMMAYCRE